MDARFTTPEPISQNEHTARFRARRLSDDSPVVIEQLRTLYPSAETLAQFRSAYELSRAAKGDGVLEPLEFMHDEGRVVIVFRDRGGLPLPLLYGTGRADLANALTAALGIARALATVHDAGVIHKDLRPEHILYDPETGVVQLTGFGEATMAPRQRIEPGTMDQRAGEVYLAPEQTGRLNRALDHRADLYSLGAILYELLTDLLPFATGDRLDLTHARIAIQPPSPSQIDTRVPTAVSNIVDLLLSKRPENRYQSAQGLAHDLELCLQQLKEADDIQPFSLRQHDIGNQLHIPEVLYGRAAELEVLERAVETATAGANELLLISGLPGIGKTSLVLDVHKQLSARRANFISGKFDQYNRGVPYASVIQAFRQFIATVLAGNQEDFKRWKRRISQAVGVNGRALTDVISELEHIIGPQPVLDVVPAPEAENRFRRVFAKFVRALARSESPLVLFLDDLQWADLPSLRLLESLATDPDLTYILMIGAYRSNELSSAHPLTRSMEVVRENGATPIMLDVGPLAAADVRDFLADALRCEPSALGRLTRLCLGKTYGNPFYLGRYIEGLHRDALLRFDTDRGAWTWDNALVEQTAMTENVVDYMNAQLRTLQPDTQRALNHGAIIGNVFGLHLLASLAGKTRRQLQSDLQPALVRNLIRVKQSGYWFTDASEDAIPDFTYVFAHDRIQQSASALGTSNEAEIHLAIGRHLLSQLPDEERAEQLFSLVEHLNRGAQLLSNQAERDEVSDLNLQAGRRALASAAYAPSHRYLTHGTQLADDDSWSRRYDSTLELYIAAAEAAYLAGDDDAMAAHIATVEANATAELDGLRARAIAVYALTARDELVPAVKTAVQILTDQGTPLKLTPEPSEIEAAIGATLALIGDRPDADLIALPSLDDPLEELKRELMVGISAPAYLAAPALLPMLAVELVQSTIRLGVSRQSPYGFALMGLVLSAGGFVDMGYRYGEIGMAMLNRWDERALRTRCSHIVYGFLQFWKVPLRDTLPGALQNYETGVDTGDLEFGLWSSHSYCSAAFYAGLPLQSLETEISTFCDLMTRHKMIPHVGVNAPYIHAIRCLRGAYDDPMKLVGPDYDEVERMEAFVAVNYRGAAFVLACCRLLVRTIFRDYAGAVDVAATANVYADGAVATFHHPVSAFHEAIALLAQRTVDDDAIERARANRERLATWAEGCADNFDHMRDLVDAELARVAGNWAAALDHYDNAIARAKANNFPHHMALANERAGMFHLSRGSRTVARAYLLECRYNYQSWGAEAKVAQLDNTHPDLLMGLTQAMPMPSPNKGDDIDLEWVWRASQALSGELRLGHLLRQVIDVTCKAAGATAGILVIERDGKLIVEASENASGDEVIVTGAALNSHAPAAFSVMQFVQRTDETVVLGDGAADSRFAADRHLAGRHVSVLCCPIMQQGRRRGMLYLENSLATDAFTPARLRTVEILSAQAAISLENAALIETLESKVQRRTAELTAARKRSDQANLAKGEFLTRVTEELRPPLAGVMHEAQDLAAQDGLVEPQRRSLRAIQRTSEHLLGLIDDVLDISSIDRPSLTLHPADVDLSALPGEVVDVVALAAKPMGIGLSLTMAPDLPTRVVADSKRLRQVLLKLLSTAVQHSSSGTVSLQVHHASGRGLTNLRFEVHVPGSVPESELESPMGLALVSQLVRLMGGTIGIQADAADHCVLSFDIPVMVI